MKKLTSWGRFPKVEASLEYPEKSKLSNLCQVPFIPRGMGRSYGDSALSKNVVSTKNIRRFIEFDEKSGLLTCDSGVSLGEILQLIVPKGWFLFVTPGTKFVSLGGAIASDVHGKNHHLDGCFSEFVEVLTLKIGDELVQCSKSKNPELFRATCGGMGLTGLIIEATIKLKPIKSAYIDQVTIKTQNLKETLEIFEQHHTYTYSVAWIDCLATANSIGRSLVMVGEHSKDGKLDEHQDRKLSIPFDFPSFVLNPYSIQAFNSLYYNKQLAVTKRNKVHYDTFFYPLDGISNWNKIYGKHGFTQYQFVIPKSAGLEGLTEILQSISDSKLGSFLAVLKVCGPENDNYLSFPLEGYSLALDFKISKEVFALLSKLDRVVQKHNGRIYLTKDVCMNEAMFKATYTQWEKFQEIRKNNNALVLHESFQSKRIGLSS
ncbi:FAD-binding oxidoreductase [Pseudoalteromonas spongiae]|uniref:FAD-binding oxidoreductase n=1 Tax=Pseudoalteromonas spongiae TaxID=298657 RepID=UPI00110AC4A1|nr:FAD-binding oxidoreductase [Pseudoalteromonas spongiae]TMO83722.1 FAD-linked oxidase [Pseudoalteromonas spongiae]